MQVNKNLLASLSLSLAVILSTWLLLVVNHANHPALSANKNEPDSFSNAVYGTRYNEQGKLLDKFYTPHMVHYPETKTTYVMAPTLLAYNADASMPPWQISAKHGVADDNLQRVVLWDQVICHQQAGAHNPSTMATTSILNLYPKRRFAETAATVTAVQPGLVTHATGLQVDLQAGTTRLLADVRGEYVPNP